MGKPREFWISFYDDGVFYQCSRNKADMDESFFEAPNPLAHVREVIDISEAELKEAADSEYPGSTPNNAFEAGARWAIAKMRGEE